MANEIILDHFHWPRFNETGRTIVLHGSKGTPYPIAPNERLISAKQVEFLNAIRIYKATLASGAMGWGKSTVIRQALIDLLIEWASQGHEGVRVTLVCETFKALKLRQVPFLLSEYGPLGVFNKQDYTFTLHEEYGSGYIQLLNADDPEKFKSIDFAACGVDELTLNREEIFRMLMKRLRWPKIGHTPFFAGTNPTGIGRQWVKETFVDNPRQEYIDDDGRKFPGFFHIHGTVYDNPTLEPEYVKELEQGTEWEVKTYVLGSWDSPEGQFIELRPGIHTVKDRPIPDDWTRYMAVDFGWRHPTVAGSLVYDPHADQYIHNLVWSQDKKTDRQAKIEIYDHFKENGLDIESFSIAVGDISGDRGGQSVKKEDTTWRVFNSDEGGRPSFKLRPAFKGRIEGWRALRELLAYKSEWRVNPETGKKEEFVTQKPKLVIFESCWETINSLTELRYADSGRDDAHKTSGTYGPGKGDDEAEMLRYLIMAAYKGKFQKRKEQDESADDRLTPRRRRMQQSTSQKFTWG